MILYAVFHLLLVSLTVLVSQSVDEKHFINGVAANVLNKDLAKIEMEDAALYDKKYITKGVGGEDFNEDPTVIIDGKPQEDEVDLNAETQRSFIPYTVFWIKYPDSWCTLNGRQFLSGEVGVEQTFEQCRDKCLETDGCNAIELWNAYNWNCYWCTNTSLIRSYTDTNDLAYPVHVWVETKWKKYHFSWCTTQGRQLLSAEIGVEQTFEECATRCLETEGCNAIELWGNYDWACYWCTNKALIKPYINKHNRSYPVHVWVKIP